MASESLTAQVLLGKQVFYNAQDTRMSNFNYLSCASCHLDGGEDGRVWDFTDRGEGLRNTATLQNRERHGPRPGALDRQLRRNPGFRERHPQRLRRHRLPDGRRVHQHQRHLGLPKAGQSAELDALAAYVASLASTPKSPYRNADGTLHGRR